MAFWDIPKNTTLQIPVIWIFTFTFTIDVYPHGPNLHLSSFLHCYICKLDKAHCSFHSRFDCRCIKTAEPFNILTFLMCFMVQCWLHMVATILHSFPPPNLPLSSCHRSFPANLQRIGCGRTIPRGQNAAQALPHVFRGVRCSQEMLTEITR